MALSNCSQQAMWIQALLRELRYKIPIIPICGDNQGSIFIESNPVQEHRLKHIEEKKIEPWLLPQMGTIGILYPSSLKRAWIHTACRLQSDKAIYSALVDDKGNGFLCPRLP